ncbi:hypothetical protein GCM10027448_01730 [Nocardioides dilutus]
MGPPRADEVEHHHPVVHSELRRDLAPHGLIAPEAVREDDRARAGRAAHVSVQPGEGVHGGIVTGHLLVPGLVRGRLGG